MQNATGEYFYSQKLNDPTESFDWEYILIDNDKVKNECRKLALRNFDINVGAKRIYQIYSDLNY